MPAATALSFRPLAAATAPGARAYHTGDLGQVSVHGCFEIQGRLDRQLKFMGARIQPEEIEAVLCRHPKVTGAAVTIEFPESPGTANPSIPHGRQGFGYYCRQAFYCSANCPLGWCRPASIGCPPSP